MAANYTRTAVTLHWLIALLIVGAFVMGTVMVDMSISPLKLKMFNWHKWLGVTVLALAALRLLWRLFNAAPPYLPMPAWQRWVAHALHLLLYVLMFAQPISGWIYSNATGYPIVYLGKLPLPTLVQKSSELAQLWKAVHYWSSMLLLALVVVHVAAALKHQFVDRDGTLRRMWYGARQS